jgi:putative thioredoxin
MSAGISAVNAASFDSDVLEASRQLPVLVDFWAEWCAPCRALAPVLEKVAATLGPRVRIVKVDTDAEQELAQRFQVRSIPAVMLFRDGKLVAQFVGAQPENAILEWLRPWLPMDPGSPRAQALAALAEGKADAARELLAAAIAADTADHASREDLAELEIRSGNIVEARDLLATLPDVRRMEPRANSIAARLFFAEELAAIGAGSSDLDDLYRAGLRDAVSGKLGQAAGLFLSLAERSRDYRGDAGKRALLQVFTAMDADDPVLGEYRRKLSRLLH